MPRKACPAGESEIRRLRLQLHLSQPQFARSLGVAAETYRAWDSGRRALPDNWLDKARALAAVEDPRRLWSLQELATQLGVHVRTLRNAARNGRLDVSYENRVVFRNLIPRATMAAGRTFMKRYYRQSYSRFAPRPQTPKWERVPSDWVRQLLRIRQELHLTQARLAEQIGAAGKAVVYQWESGKRKPSLAFWTRIEELHRSLWPALPDSLNGPSTRAPHYKCHEPRLRDTRHFLRVTSDGLKQVFQAAMTASWWSL
jgi:DNA-binding transcriptional regulator YiaG